LDVQKTCMSGLGLGLRQEDGAVVLDTRPEHEWKPGIIHFAVLATMAEIAAAEAVGAPVSPASFTMSLLERASPGRLEARGRVLRKGKRLAVVEGEVFSRGVLVAKAVTTFALLQ